MKIILEVVEGPHTGKRYEFQALRLCQLVGFEEITDYGGHCQVSDLFQTEVCNGVLQIRDPLPKTNR